MCSFRKVIFILIVLGTSIVAPLELWAEEPMVLTVRPELLQKETKDQVPVQVNNPFVWRTEKSAKGKVTTKKQADEAFSGLRVEGILWNKNNPQAIVNGKLVSENDELQGVTIKKIGKDYLTVMKGGLSHKLKFNELKLNLKQ